MLLHSSIICSLFKTHVPWGWHSHRLLTYQWLYLPISIPTNVRTSLIFIWILNPWKFNKCTTWHGTILAVFGMEIKPCSIFQRNQEKCFGNHKTLNDVITHIYHSLIETTKKDYPSEVICESVVSMKSRSARFRAESINPRSLASL